MKHRLLTEVANGLGIELSGDQIDRLDSYGEWLLTEALPAGGLGRDEAERLERRHVIDSLLFKCGFDEMPAEIRDLGSGVGLPAIPLAITHPNIRFELVDRSGKRVDLAKRAVRVLDLSNVTVRREDISRIEVQTSGIVSRASISPGRLIDLAKKQLRPGGTAVVGGSWRQKPVESGWETRKVLLHSLDQPVWLLIMRRQ